MSDERNNRKQEETPLEHDHVVPVVHEELAVSKQTIPTGSVEIRKHVEEETRNIELDLSRETVEVRHIPVNVTIGAVPPVREDGDTLIVPVVEEEVVVTKRLVLREEIHITKRRTTEHISQAVTVAREVVDIRRQHTQGRRNPDDESGPPE